MSSAGGSIQSAVSLQKFERNKTNFNTWYLRFKQTIAGWGYSDALKDIPEGATDGEKKKHQASTERVLGLLNSCLDDVLMRRCSDMTTPIEVLDYLKKQFDRATPARRKRFEEELNELKLGSSTIQDFGTLLLVKFDNIDALRNNAGVPPLSEPEKLGKLYDAVPHEAQKLIVQYQLDVGDKDAKFDDCIMYLDEREIFFKKAISKPTPEVAFASHDNNSILGLQPQDVNQVVHAFLDAGWSLKNRATWKILKPHLKCDGCKASGHTSHVCPTKRDKSKSDHGHSLLDEMALGAMDSEVLMSVANEAIKDSFIVDSAATRHMCGNINWFKPDSLRELTTPIRMTVANNATTVLTHSGDIEIILETTKGKQVKLTVSDVFYAANGFNLFSTATAAAKGASFKFAHQSGSMFIKNKQFKLIKNGKLFLLNGKPNCFETSMNTQPEHALALSEEVLNHKNGVWDINHLHQVCGHRNETTLRQMFRDGHFIGVTKIVGEFRKCEACLLGKPRLPDINRKPSSDASEDGEESVTKLAVDLSGKISPTGLSGANYTVTFDNSADGMAYGSVISLKSEVYKPLPKVLAQLPSDKKVIVKSDNAPELKGGMFSEILETRGINQEFSAPHHAHQNGRIERKQATIWQMMRTQMIHAKLPSRFWDYAFSHSVQISNLIGTPPPMFKSKGLKTDMTNRHTFGCKVYVKHVGPEIDRIHKAQPKADVGVYLGQAPRMSNDTYLVYLPSRDKVLERRGVTFCDDRFFNFDDMESELRIEGVEFGYEIEPADMSESSESEESSFSNEEVTQPQERRSSTRVADMERAKLRKKYDKALYFQTYNQVVEEMTHDGKVLTNDEERLAAEEANKLLDEYYAENPDELAASVMDFTNVPEHEWHEEIQDEQNLALFAAMQHMGTDVLNANGSIKEPKTFEAAINDPVYGQEWTKAAQKEYNVCENKAFEFVDEVPKGTNVLDTKWVFKYKALEKRFKARLCVRGYKQRNAENTYAPVARIVTIRFLFMYAVSKGQTVHFFDVSEAFLNGELLSQTYLKPIEGFAPKGKYIKLKSMLYGLKDSPIAFYETFTRELRRLGCVQSLADQCLFQYKTNCYMVVYVDDAALCGEEALVKELKTKLAETFELRSTDDTKYFIGQRITQENGTIEIDQYEYVEELAKEFGLSDCKKVEAPFEIRLKPFEEGDEAWDVAQYRSIVGKLNWVATGTRPDIAYDVKELSRHLHKPSKVHWLCGLLLIKFLIHNQAGLTFGEWLLDVINFEVFADSDWGQDPTTRKSTTGYLVRFAGNLLTWKSKTQATIAKSSAEAELIALTSAINEVRYLEQIADFFNIDRVQSNPSIFLKDKLEHPNTSAQFFGDNQAALKVIGNATSMERTKHMDIKYKSAWHEARQRGYRFKYVETAKQLADGLTKPLNKKAHRQLFSQVVKYK